MTSSSNALQPVSNLAILYKQGGVVNVASNTTLSVTAGLFRSSLDNYDINVGDYFGSAINTVVDSSSVGVLNGLDTGVLQASKVYAVWAIADQSNNNPSGYLLSLSTTSPVLPTALYSSGYNVMRRIGWVVTDSSTHFIPQTISGTGNTVYYNIYFPISVLSSGTATTQTAISLAACVPAVDGMPVLLGPSFLPAAAGRGARICPSGAAVASSVQILTGQVAATPITDNFYTACKLISGVPKIDYVVSNSDSALTIFVAGFIDLL